MIYNKKSILISLFLILPLQISFAQINNTSNHKLDNTTTVVTIEDSIVGEKLEQVQNQNQSNTAGKIIEELVSEEEPKKE
ncbi:MAG TPA: hypothetical protein VIZ62_10070 [Nitrososphaeraceae archaeon]